MLQKNFYSTNYTKYMNYKWSKKQNLKLSKISRKKDLGKRYLLPLKIPENLYYHDHVKKKSCVLQLTFFVRFKLISTVAIFNIGIIDVDFGSWLHFVCHGLRDFSIE